MAEGLSLHFYRFLLSIMCDGGGGGSGGGNSGSGSVCVLIFFFHTFQTFFQWIWYLMYLQLWIPHWCRTIRKEI